MATSLTRRNPFGATDPFVSRMWDWFATPVGQTPMSRLFGEGGSYIPPIDIYETREEVVVAASLPALDLSKLSIEVQDDSLTLKGEQQPFVCFDAEDGATQHLGGIPRYGNFNFNFQLPVPVDTAEAQANYKNGVLCMRFLKSQKNRPVRISVQTEADARSAMIAQSGQEVPVQGADSSAPQANANAESRIER
jgi:HSP20 family protein